MTNACYVLTRRCSNIFNYIARHITSETALTVVYCDEDDAILITMELYPEVLHTYRIDSASELVHMPDYFWEMAARDVFGQYREDIMALYFRT